VRGLANGIYLARLELVTAGGDVAATRKVLVAR
jgi:hypothetical protein